MLAAIHEIPSGDVILLHASCHNPTGIDPTLEQWQQISDLIAERSLLPLIDCAYQGFGDGLEEDVQGLKLILEKSSEALITTSCSKNFGLYNERIGALSVVAAEPEHCNNVFSQACNCIRANYSNPPAHGAAIVTTILSDQALRQQWETELSEMRTRIHRMRTELVKNLSTLSNERDFSFIATQKGMFSYSGLSRDEVKYLKDKYAIYAVDSGRINIAGINDGNLERLSQAIAEAIDR